MSSAISESVFLDSTCINIYDAQLLAEAYAVLRARVASLVLFDALIAIESATFKLAWQLIWIKKLLDAVFDAA